VPARGSLDGVPTGARAHLDFRRAPPSTPLPLASQNVYIRKVKTLKAPKFDLTRLLEFHGDSEGSAVKKAEEAPLVESLEGAGGRL
jgi:hypothetical protein